MRELRNVIERVLILNPKATRIEPKHLPMLVTRRTRWRARPPDRREEFSTLLQAREAYERDYILKKTRRVPRQRHPRRRSARPRTLATFTAR